MKKGLCLLGLVAMLMSVPAISHAHSYDSDDAGHPLRYIAYVVHPVGVALQEYIFRPLHRWLSASEARGFWFGHQVHENDTY